MMLVNDNHTSDAAFIVKGNIWLVFDDCVKCKCKWCKNWQVLPFRIER